MNRLDGLGDRIPAREKRPDRLWGPHTLLLSGYLSFPRVKLLGREFNHLRLSIAEVKNEWSCISTPCVCLHDVYRDNFNFFPVYHLCVGKQNTSHHNEIFVIVFIL